MLSDWRHAIPLDTSTAILLALFVIACCTRVITGREFQSALTSRASPKVPAIAPYVTPYLGHFVTFCYTDPLRWMKKLRHHVPHQPFAAHIWGRNFYVITNQELIQSIFYDHAASLSFASVRWYLLVNVFGARRWHPRASQEALEDAHRCFKSLEGSKLSSLIQRSIMNIQEEAPNLVSSSESIVDENPWERPSSPRIISANRSIEGKPLAVQVDMFALVRNFVGHITILSLVGTNFLEIQPKFLEKLWSFESGWQYILLGLPRWLPIPGLPKVYIARRYLNCAMRAFHRAMDNSATGEKLEQGWNDLDEVSTLFSDRSATWRVHKTSADVKASADLSLLWSANVKPSNLIFWVLLHIFSSPGLLDEIRLEISSYVTATQPPNTFGISEPPRLKFKDVEGLAGACPLLKACLYECLRLYSRPLSLRKVTKTFSVTGTTNNNLTPSACQTFAIESGTYLVVPLGLQNHENSSFDDPQHFTPSRFLSFGPDGKQKCDRGALRPWGVGEAACPGRWFAEKQVLAFVAAIVSLWDIEPTGLRGWEIPSPSVHSVVAAPKADIRVLIRARELSSAQG